MNRLVIALPILLCIAGVASSQSLADIAKNEKERRKENAKQGNKTVFEAESVGSFGPCLVASGSRGDGDGWNSIGEVRL